MFLDVRYDVMKKCWKLSPSERPRFSTLANTLDKTLESVAGYTELSMTLVQPTVSGDEQDYDDVIQPQSVKGASSKFRLIIFSYEAYM